MLIQLNTDNHVDGRDEAMREVETDLNRTLARFSSQITRIGVHFRDTNAEKSGASDKECTLEARVAGQDPTAVTHSAATLTAAFHGAREKLVRVLDKRLAKLRPPKGVDPFDRPAVDQGMSL
ncbi:HPF/RaiA family ribosome-associated protein [Gemmatimonas groenlandica]|uniref:Ribosomal subunit interface protein n=1 Tax=Gemmatimonas groenlandica TaxID=2732249 RepID=A0A6M4IXE2_9BACT|nr:HPF/RaiA family ribosome-associated protein [Gemmatimonas groenlandica]QJR36841.1 ribosomal subunit interface protein [Gemmatimonas groenlandica]